VELTKQLLNRFARYFRVFCQGLRKRKHEAQITQETLIRHGRLRLAGDGDSIRTAALVDRDPNSHDNSFVKVYVFILCIHHLLTTLATLVRSLARC
jgi:hypothetical protein